MITSVKAPSVSRLFEPGGTLKLFYRERAPPEISEPTGWLQSETQSHQCGYFLNGATQQNFSIENEQLHEISEPMGWRQSET
jgi:hypothetical protein